MSVFFLVLLGLIVLGISYPQLHKTFILKKEIVNLKKLIHSQSFSKAQKLISKLLKSKPKHTELLYLQAEIQIAQKQAYLAIYTLDEIIKNNDYPEPTKSSETPTFQWNEVMIRNKKIEIYQNLKKYPEIINECQKILAFEPNNMTAKYYLGKKYFGLKNYKAAKELLQAIEPDFEKYHDVLAMIVDILFIEKDYQTALTTVEELINDNTPPSCQILHKQAKIYFYLKDYNKCLKIIYKIDQIYQWPLDLKLIEVISLFQHYQLDNLSDITKLATAQIPSNETDYLINKFEAILSKYLSEEELLIVPARYYYSKLLIKQKELRKALVQIKFIEDSEKHYLDNYTQKTIYEKIYYDEFLLNFFTINWQDKTNHLIKILQYLITERNSKWLLENKITLPVKLPLAPLAYCFHFKQIKDTTNLYVVFSMDQNFDETTLNTLLQNQTLSKGDPNDLKIYSLLPLKSDIAKILVKFDEVTILSGEKFLNTLKSNEETLTPFIPKT